MKNNLHFNQFIKALVLDVGPWNINDDAYVFGSDRPQAESGKDKFGRTTNGAGIDLGEFVWRSLNMLDNGEVEWHFEEEDFDVEDKGEDVKHVVLLKKPDIIFILIKKPT